ncbi:hypothetical protein K439DRAFT_1138598 [Ramaria rubella]|nr:hypothetical protein K439DRAFT_1138598 [Ramaria rubella]
MTPYFTVWYIDSRCTLVTTPVILAGSQELQKSDLYLHFDGEGSSPMRMWVHASSNYPRLASYLAEERNYGKVQASP